MSQMLFFTRHEITLFLKIKLLILRHLPVSCAVVRNDAESALCLVSSSPSGSILQNLSTVSHQGY